MYVGVNRVGGLGNQLFQYAAARAVAVHYGVTRILLEKESLNGHNHLGYNYVQAVFDGKEDQELLDSISTIFDQGGFADPWNVADVPEPPVRLGGYFQYLPAIEPIIPDIRAMIHKNLAVQREMMRERFSIVESNSVFLHIRRGDYLQKSYYHYVQPIGYYMKAYDRMSRKEEKIVYIISDDDAWVKRQDWEYNHVVVEEEDELMVFALMSLCRGGAIIANSSFSWWGAIVADPEEVFYPHYWVDAHIPCLFPKEWTCIS